MTPEEIKRIVDAVQTHGASISFQDARLTKGLYWLLGVAFTAILTVNLQSQAATQEKLNALSEQNATLLAELKYQREINQAQDARLSIYDDRLRAVERQIK